MKKFIVIFSVLILLATSAYLYQRNRPLSGILQKLASNNYTERMQGYKEAMALTAEDRQKLLAEVDPDESKKLFSFYLFDSSAPSQYT